MKSKGLVIVRLVGGLGNQMFQYAAGRAHALACGSDLLLHVADLEKTWTPRKCVLENAFRIPARIAEPEDVARVLEWKTPLRKVLLRRNFFGLRGKRLVVEPQFTYWSEIRAAESTCYLAGYWQSERYFSDIANRIREDFCFRDELTHDNEVVRSEIASSVAVSVHVRRGDYVTNPKIAAFHGVCAPEYYERAVAHIRSRYGSARFFVFSDDIDWARTHIPVPAGSCFVAGNAGVADYRDMHLMSLCHHHVVANSTFSWWGAWLGAEQDKIVVAPKNWFDSAQQDTSTLFPPAWQLM
jgi:hypothetical protein